MLKKFYEMINKKPDTTSSTSSSSSSDAGITNSEKVFDHTDAKPDTTSSTSSSSSSDAGITNSEKVFDHTDAKVNYIKGPFQDDISLRAIRGKERNRKAVQRENKRFRYNELQGLSNRRRKLSDDQLFQRREKDRVAKAKARQKDDDYLSRRQLSYSELAEKDRKLADRREKDRVARAKARQDPDVRFKENRRRSERKVYKRSEISFCDQNYEAIVDVSSYLCLHSGLDWRSRLVSEKESLEWSKEFRVKLLEKFKYTYLIRDFVDNISHMQMLLKIFPNEASSIVEKYKAFCVSRSFVYVSYEDYKLEEHEQWLAKNNI
jgi:hypothetical protein